MMEKTSPSIICRRSDFPIGFVINQTSVYLQLRAASQSQPRTSGRDILPVLCLSSELPDYPMGPLGSSTGGALEEPTFSAKDWT